MFVDPEVKALLQAVADGRITEHDRCMSIFATGMEEIAKQVQALRFCCDSSLDMRCSSLESRSDKADQSF